MLSWLRTLASGRWFGHGNRQLPLLYRFHLYKPSPM
jgi:hypothetical protein